MKETQTKVQFQLKDIIPVVALIGIAGIYAAYILKVQSDVGDGFTANSLEANATIDAQTGVANITSNFPTIGLIAAAVIIIGMLSFLLVTR